MSDSIGDLLFLESTRNIDLSLARTLREIIIFIYRPPLSFTILLS